jgi:hypothetical protein
MFRLVTGCEWYWGIPCHPRPEVPITDTQIERDGYHRHVEYDLRDGRCGVCIHGHDSLLVSSRITCVRKNHSLRVVATKGEEKET